VGAAGQGGEGQDGLVPLHGDHDSWSTLASRIYVFRRAQPAALPVCASHHSAEVSAVCEVSARHSAWRATLIDRSSLEASPWSLASPIVRPAGLGFPQFPQALRQF